MAISKLSLSTTLIEEVEVEEIAQNNEEFVALQVQLGACVKTPESRLHVAVPAVESVQSPLIQLDIS